jgi:nicotinamidase/pyrazinamidase
MREALLIVDFQNDFTPGGALAVPHGDEIAGRVNALIESRRFELIVATRDWHPRDHSSFRDQGGPWPPHCVAGTEGAQLHPSLQTSKIGIVLDKGLDRDSPGYSGFEGTDLARILHDRGIEAVTVVGLATDYCVKHTALDALREGIAVSVDQDGVRGIDDGDSRRALEEVRAAGGRVAAS